MTQCDKSGIKTCYNYNNKDFLLDGSTNVTSESTPYGPFT